MEISYISTFKKSLYHSVMIYTHNFSILEPKQEDYKCGISSLFQ